MSYTLSRDSDWAAFDGLMFKVSHFTPLAKIENGRVTSVDRTMPYAFVDVECVERLEPVSQEIVGEITHKIDFENLWAALIDRGVAVDETVVIVWYKSALTGIMKMFSVFMPGLVVMIFKNHAFRLLTDPKFQPELRGEARFLAELPVAEWRPDVLK
jgi:hypothetical protein